MLCKRVPVYFDIDVLPEPQRRLWEMLDGTPSGFVLYGGTALALRLGHRQSVDFDFFSRDIFQPDALRRNIPYLSGSLTIRSEENTLSCVLNLDGEVMVSFFGGLRMSSVNDPDKADGPGILVASLPDIAATKAAAVQSRANAKDYIDLDALLRSGLSLEEALGAANAVFGAEFNPLVTLKALAHYGDGNLHQVPNEVRVNLMKAVAAVNVEGLPVFEPHARLCPDETVSEPDNGF